jgi:hypothetical protein
MFLIRVLRVLAEIYHISSDIENLNLNSPLLAARDEF